MSRRAASAERGMSNLSEDEVIRRRDRGDDR
jgi:hypothetical protein